MSKLVNITDIIDFGVLKGEKFFWIYRLKVDYLEWLIKNTELCFYDLTSFYQYGKVLQIKEDVLKDKIELILVETLDNPPMYKSSNMIFITIKNLGNLISNEVLTQDDFIEIHYKFSDEIINVNNEKLINSQPYYNSRLKSNIGYLHNFFYEF